MRPAEWTPQCAADHAPARSAAQGAGDDQVLDLVGAFAYLEDLRVAVEASDRRLEHVADAAVDLHGLRRSPRRHATGLELGHRRFLLEGLPGVAQVGGTVGEPAGRLELGGDV